VKRLVLFLSIAVVSRMVLQALYVPAFEAPDEPQHLARVLDFARRPLPEAFEGRWVDGDIVASVLAHPCPHPELGCPSYAEIPGAFDLLRRPKLPPRTANRYPNAEAKQPPLFYLAAGLPLRAVGAGRDPMAALLYVRLLSVGLVTAALFFPLRRTFAHRPALAVAGLVALCAPGAAEAFARCSNDAALFLWAAAVVAALEKRPVPLWMAALLAAGPLIKLTALPVAAFAVVALWRESRRGAAAAGALASLLVFLVQAVRGWSAGGVLELAPQGPQIADSFSGWTVGFAKTAYTLVKAPFWAMGWHLLRPPPAILAVYLGLLLAFLLTQRPAAVPRRRLAHAAGAIVMAAGFAAFTVATRRSLGVWGAVAGWYVWDWSPWLAVAARDLTRVEPRFARPLFAIEALVVVASNVAWFVMASAAYGR